LTHRLIAPLALAISVVGACGSEAPPYSACEGASDCEAPSDACYDVSVERDDGTTGRASFCSLGCTAHADCPLDGACLALEARPDLPICWARCTTTDECPSPLLCTMVTGAEGISTICMP
jgi:hypothetical protein